MFSAGTGWNNSNRPGNRLVVVNSVLGKLSKGWGGERSYALVETGAPAGCEVLQQLKSPVPARPRDMFLTGYEVVEDGTAVEGTYIEGWEQPDFQGQGKRIEVMKVFAPEGVLTKNQYQVAVALAQEAERNGREFYVYAALDRAGRGTWLKGDSSSKYSSETLADIVAKSDVSSLPVFGAQKPKQPAMSLSPIDMSLYFGKELDSRIRGVTDNLKEKDKALNFGAVVGVRKTRRSDTGISMLEVEGVKNGMAADLTKYDAIVLVARRPNGSGMAGFWDERVAVDLHRLSGGKDVFVFSAGEKGSGWHRLIDYPMYRDDRKEFERRLGKEFAGLDIFGEDKATVDEVFAPKCH